MCGREYIVGHGSSFFNWNEFYELQRNTGNLYFCLICYQLDGKVHNFSNSS